MLGYLRGIEHNISWYSPTKLLAEEVSEDAFTSEAQVSG